MQRKRKVHLNGFIRLTIGSSSLPRVCTLLGLGLLQKGDEGKEGACVGLRRHRTELPE